MFEYKACRIVQSACVIVSSGFFSFGNQESAIFFMLGAIYFQLMSGDLK